MKAEGRVKLSTWHCPCGKQRRQAWHGGEHTQDHHHHHQPEGPCQATKIYHYGYIFFGLQVWCIASTPSADCLCSYLAPGCQFPLGFGCRPAVPKALRSTTLLDRNSFLNDTAGFGGTEHIPGAHGFSNTPEGRQWLFAAWFTHRCHAVPSRMGRQLTLFKEKIFPGQEPVHWNMEEAQEGWSTQQWDGRFKFPCY